MRTQEEWQARERELLETTNRYLERAREYKSKVKDLTVALGLAHMQLHFHKKEIKHG